MRNLAKLDNIGHGDFEAQSFVNQDFPYSLAILICASSMRGSKRSIRPSWVSSRYGPFRTFSSKGPTSKPFRARVILAWVHGGTRGYTVSDCLKHRINARLRAMGHRKTMSVAAHLLLSSAVGCLLMAFVEGQAAAQDNTIPPLIRRPEPGRSGQLPTTGPLNKLASTGLAENGGSIANGVYTNSIYGFSLNIPPGWVVVPAPQPAPVTPDSGKDSIPGATQTIRIILIITENAPLKKNYERKSIQISVLQLGAPAGPHTARDYIAFAERTAQEKGLKVKYLGNPGPVTINGQQLWKAKMNETINGTVQHIEQYATTEGRTVLQFMLVSPQVEGLKSLQPSIQSLRFKDAATNGPANKPAAKKSKQK